MRREASVPRPDWRSRCEGAGFWFHSVGGTYWDESACYALEADQVDRLEEAAGELHRMCLEAVDEVVRGARYDAFAIPREFHGWIADSWRRREPSLYGRFDFSWDGRGEPKLLEYNADTPTALLEASVVQWHWLEDTRPGADQFNSLHEKLLERWRAIKEASGDAGGRPRLHLACVRESEEDLGTVEYLRDCALQAGWDARPLFVEDIGWDGERFVDAANEPLQALFKLYPWEWLVREDFGPHLPAAGARYLEPPWKMLLSNKAILVVLWEMFYGHPNLLPAYFDAGRFAGDYVKKPILGREGANVSLRRPRGAMSSPGTYGEEGHVYQGLAELPSFDGRYPVLGAWIVGDEPAGLGIREDDTPITRNSSRFIPHYFR